ncbi:MAG: hypothetical protein NC548_58285 [Lachnospiraceae bacterium]|nr:hypothetical protein [Lachnospiraceae bacterium]
MKMKEYKINDIEAMTEADAVAIALETLDVKGHTIYLVDFGGYFGYSCLVFKNGHHIRYANDYELHHQWRNATREQLRDVYLQKMRDILFTPEEIAAPLSDYTDYHRREYYLRNCYGMQEDHISMFCTGGTKQEVEERKQKIKEMIFNPIAFAYYTNAEFVREHNELFKKLEAARDSMSDNFEYWKSAFKYEMANHEYAINWQADYDTLSAFGNIRYHGDDADEVEQYFNELRFTETQRKAYWAARREYLREANC